VPTIDDVVDASVAGDLRITVEQLRAPQTLVVPWARDDAVYLYRNDLACVIAVGAARVDAVRAQLDGRVPDDAFSRGTAAELALPGSVVLGPSLHAYADASTFRGAPHPAVGRVDPGDDRLRALRDACGLDEWGEGGFPLDPATAGEDIELFGYVDGDALAAAGNMTDWRGTPADVGVVTHPARRRAGLATAVAATMAGQAIERFGIVRYRALATNTASLAVAARLGFRPRGANIVARPPRTT
jgi:GNAT superfamily N-acetyltransferase